jgi:hypothetical protein
MRARKIGALQEVMRAVADWLPDILAALPPAHRPLLANALLNLSVNDILEEEGGAVTASILERLAALIRAGDRPDDSDGFRLNGQDA